MLKSCPDPIDVQDLQFKLHCSLKVFNNDALETFPNNYSLVSCASRFGLVFVGTNTNSLKVIHLESIREFTPKEKEISKYLKRNVPLSSVPKHVSVNCDSTIVAVVLEKDNIPVVVFYDVLSFYKQNVTVIKEVRLSATPGVYVTEVNWNPALPNIFTACKSDKSLGIYEIKGNAVDINELPQAAQSTCFCWSPKGKQLAVGSVNGNITQYKPDLKAVKIINGPKFETPHTPISLCWVSNFQFIGVYQSAEEDGQAKLIVVDAPKTGEPTYTNYDDVCYSSSSRRPQFYLMLLQQWNILMVASSNSTEVGTLGATSEFWTQWNVPDFGRAELPLSADKQDTLPIGMSLDISSTKSLPWGEGTIPPCPELVLLSHQGVLYFFNIVNLKPDIPSICCAPDRVSDTSGMGQFNTETEQNNQSQPQQQQLLKPTFGFGTIQTPSSQQQSNPQSFPSLNTQPALQSFQFTQASTFQPPQPQVTITPQPSQPLQTSQPQSAFNVARPTPTQAMLPKSTPPTLFGKPIGNESGITEVKPLQQPAVSTSLFSGQSVTITPVSKPQTSSGNNEKYATIFAALQSTTAATTPDTKPIVISTKTTKSDTVSKEPPTPDTPKSSNIDVKAALDEKVKIETEALLSKLVKDECVALESELRAVLHQGKSINVNIGTEDEKLRMVEELESLTEFIKEIVEVSLAESSEVHTLKQNLILSWAWYEEALSRYNVSKDETVTILLKNQPLDSAAEKRQTDIRKILYYIESQLYQASKALDEQWDKFQDYAKKTHKVQMPTMEAIFQCMVRNNVILEKQRYKLKDIQSRLKNKKTSSATPSLFLSLQNTEKLEESLSRLQLDPIDNEQILYEQIMERNNTLSLSKRTKLRTLLKSHKLNHVTASKPHLNSSISLIRSPVAKNTHLISILGAQMSPVPKPAAVKNLQFSESTPIKKVQEIKPTIVPPNTPAQTNTPSTFTFKGIEPTFVIPGQNQTNTSAFVPTIPTSKVFLVPSTASTTFNPQPKQEPSLFSNKINFGTGISVTPIAGKKPESAPVTKSEIKLTTSDSSSLFSFGKLPSSAAINSSTTTTTINTSSFSFGKTISVADSTLGTKQDIKVSSAPINFSTTTATTTLTSATNKVTMPVNTTFSFNFGAGLATTTSVLGVAVTTTTNSIHGSIASPSIASSIFGAKPDVATSVVDSSKSIIKNIATTTSKSIFAPSSSIISSTSAFNPVSSSTPSQTPVSTAGTTKPASAITLPTTTKSAILSSVTTSTVTSTLGSTSIFGSVSVSNSTFAGSVTPSTTVAVTSSIISTVTSANSLFKSTTTTTSQALTKSSIFGVPSSFGTTTTQSSIFGSNAGSLVSNATVTSATSTIQPSKTPATAAPSLDKTTTTIQESTVSSNVPSTTPSLFGSALITTSGESAFTPHTTTTTTKSFSFAQGVISDKNSTSTSPSVSSPQGSIFGSNSTTTSPSVTSQGSVFGSNATVTSLPAITQGSIFGSNTISTSSSVTSQGSLFDSNATSTSPSVTSQGSIFGSNATSTSPSVTSQGSIFGTNATVKSPSATSQGSIFGSNTATPSPISSQGTVFGSNTTSSGTSTIFGAISTTPSLTTSAGSIFGTNTSNTPSIFPSNATTTQASVFGSNTNSSVANAQTSIFGSNTPSNTSVFGTTQGSIFGTPTTATTTTQSSVFGAPVSSSGSIFGNALTTQGSIFGTSPTVSTQGSIFGATSASTTSVFGGSANSAPAFGTNFSSNSIFGAKTTTFGSPSTFGTPETTTGFSQPAAPFGSSSGSIFGAPTTSTSVFGSSNTFGAVSSSNNVFGSGNSSSFSFASAANQGGSLGFGDLSVGNNPSSGGSIFGGSPSFGQTPPNPFARAGSGTNTFGTPASTAGSVFGSSTGSVFGQPSTFGSSSFGSPSGFGQQSSFGQSSTFGANSSFGNTQAGPFSGGAGAVAQTGFGTPTGFQKSTGGFGAPPAFGGSPQPAFGANPTFGGSPAFGGAATFGSPSKVFGATTPNSSFGQSTGTASPGFGNLASQNTVGFGSLAQQAANPNNTQFSGGSSFSSWR